MQEAREIIERNVSARNDKDVVLFCGNGVTGCVLKMIEVLRLRFVFCFCL